jgi:uncharacterized membrane protein
MYGVVLLACALAWRLLARAIARLHRDDPSIADFGRSVKSRLSTVLYASAIGLAFVHPWLADAIYVTVAVMWFVPDRRIEALASQEGSA